MPTMSGAFHWSPDPVLRSFGPVAVRWYGLCFAAAFLVGYWVKAQIYKNEGRDPSSLDRLLMYRMIGTLIGARLGHVIFYDPPYDLAHPLDIVMGWEGELASQEGAAGILIALLPYTRKPGPVPSVAARPGRRANRTWRVFHPDGELLQFGDRGQADLRLVDGGPRSGRSDPSASRSGV
jgi:prolipoprotein diacylglyceryltransferase